MRSKNMSFTIKESQLFLFAFLIAGAFGTFFGGPLSDRFGKKKVISVSMLATVPFSLLIPFVPSSAWRLSS